MGMPHNAGRVSLLVQFRPREARAAAAWLARRERLAVTVDPSQGNITVEDVAGGDLCALTERLYRRGARCIFVRYAHEGRAPIADSPGKPRHDPRPN